jgi:O-antigen ligase
MRTRFTGLFKVHSWEAWTWFFIWFSLPLSIRLNSLAIVFGGLVMLVSYIRKPHPLNGNRVLHFILPFLFFGAYSIGAFQNVAFLPAMKGLEKMGSFIVIPVLFLLSSTNKKAFTQASLTGLVLSLLMAGTVMMVFSFWQFLHSWDLSSFTYQQLISPFDSGAIYFSLLLLTTLFQINDVEWLSGKIALKRFLIVFFLLLLLLAASKILIGIGIPLLIWNYRRELHLSVKNQKTTILLILLLAFLALIPFTQRLKTLFHPHLEQIGASQYRYDSPLNGLNLRLIQWRFGLEILNESNDWITGVGIHEAQKKLNQKYVQYGLYTGYEGTSDTGYLNYNFHNQYIETLVRSGIIGLMILLTMFVRLFLLPKSTLFAMKWIIFICFVFFMTESALERQLGIVYFCLIYSSYFHGQIKHHISDET